MSGNQPSINSFFVKNKTVNACSQAFLRQYNALPNNTVNEINQQNDQSEKPAACCKHLEEISHLKSTAIKLQDENHSLKEAVHLAENRAKISSDKYNNMKSKYIKLLDMLMDKETTISKLQLGRQTGETSTAQEEFSIDAIVNEKIPHTFYVKIINGNNCHFILIGSNRSGV